MLSDERLNRYKDEIDEEEPIQETIEHLRDDGLSRLEAVRVLLAVLDVSLREAKHLLLTNDTWAEAQEHNEQQASEGTRITPPPPAPG